MMNRKKLIMELMQSFHSLKHRMAFRPAGSVKKLRVTPSQWGVIMFIGHHSGSTVKDVAEALGITSSAATQLVDGLVASGYVVRKMQAKDRRAVVLTLSKTTKTRVERMRKQAVQKFLRFFEALNDKEFNQYISLNKKIVEKVRANATFK